MNLTTLLGISGVKSVQRGYITAMSNTDNTVVISPVDPAKCVVSTNITKDDATNYIDSGLAVKSLTSTQLVLRFGETGFGARQQSGDWQVIEYE